MGNNLQKMRGWLSGLFTRKAEPDFWKTYSNGYLRYGGSSHAGIVSGVNPVDACTIAAVSCCVQLISGTIASLPLFTYRRSGEGWAKSVDHPLFDLLHSYPNPEFGRVDLWTTVLNDSLLWGNGFIEIERYQNDSPRALWWLPASSMSAQYDDNQDLWYTWSGGHQPIHLPARNVIHVRSGPIDLSGIMATSIISRASASLGLTLSSEQVAQAMMDQGLRPSAVLQHPGRLSSEAVERLRADFTRVHGGAGASGKIAILENGMTLNPYQSSAADSQFLEQRTFAIKEVARWFNVPLSKLKATDSPGFKGIDAENAVFLTDCLQPLITRIEQEICLKCFRPADRRTHKVEHLLDGLLRASPEKRASMYSIGRNWGWFSVNDIRKLEGMDPVDGGDERLSPINMQPLAGGKGVGARAPAGQMPVEPASSVDPFLASESTLDDGEDGDTED